MDESQTTSELLSLMIEAQMQMALVLASAFPDNPPTLLTDRVSAKFLRMAALLEGDGPLSLPSDIAIALHTNALRLQGLRDPDAPA